MSILFYMLYFVAYLLPPLGVYSYRCDETLWAVVSGGVSLVGESDDVLVERAKVEPEAFGKLYEKYVSNIYNYVYYRTGDNVEAEDLTARVFFQALTHIKGYTNRGLPFSAWLYRIAHNIVANWYRDKSHHRNISLDLVEMQLEDESDTTGDIDEKNDVRRLIGELPPDRQHLIVLKYVEGLSNAEIGKIMGRSEGAVKALLFRTLRSLREEIDAERDKETDVKRSAK